MILENNTDTAAHAKWKTSTISFIAKRIFHAQQIRDRVLPSVATIVATNVQARRG